MEVLSEYLARGDMSLPAVSGPHSSECSGGTTPKCHQLDIRIYFAGQIGALISLGAG